MAQKRFYSENKITQNIDYETIIKILYVGCSADIGILQ